MTAQTLGEWLRLWADSLRSVSDSARLDAEILVKHVSGLSDAQLILAADDILDQAIVQDIEILLKARMDGKPIAYLVGHREFYGLNLLVNEHVLIPRPETELLVKAALDAMTPSTKRCLDLGTGSGAVALALAVNASGLSLLAVDHQPKALAMAKQNTKRLGLDNIDFRLGHWYAALGEEKFDLIVANPPYISPQDEHLGQGDVRFEPAHALVAADQGLADLCQIIQEAPNHLNAAAYLIVEHGYDQGSAVSRLFKRYDFNNIQTQTDLNGLPRITSGRI